jgi:hypothetical protein
MICVTLLKTYSRENTHEILLSILIEEEDYVDLAT